MKKLAKELLLHSVLITSSHRQQFGHPLAGR
jgi:hypothetical protein